jgi:hypothetical protein
MEIISPLLANRLVPNSKQYTPHSGLLVDVWRLIFNYTSHTAESKRSLATQCKLFRDSLSTLSPMFRKMALHPVYHAPEVLRFAQARSKESRWTRSVARAFGAALKASKHCDLLQPIFVEAIHPKWKRWRCAKIILSSEDIVTCPHPATLNIENNDPANLTVDQSASIIKQLTEQATFHGTPGTDTAAAQNALAQLVCSNGDGGLTTTTYTITPNGPIATMLTNASTLTTPPNAPTTITPITTTTNPIQLDLLFYDGEHHARVSTTDMRPIPFSSVPLLDASDHSNYLRLLELIRGSVLFNSSETLRIGCSLIISQTVGDTDAREKLCEIGCASVVVAAMQNVKHIGNGDLMESLSRVCMNLACSDQGITDFAAKGGIELSLKLM